MKTIRNERQWSESGALVPVLWVAVTLAGLLVIGQHPGASADDAASAAQPPFQAAPYVSSDPSLPAAGGVFPEGASDEPAAAVPTF